MMKPFSCTPMYIAIAALVCAASIVSCESDLLGTPPSTVSITLLSEPTVTVDDDSAALLCTTSQNSTVTIEYGTVSGTYDFASVRTTAESTNHSVSLTNLTPLTTYYYRVVSWFEGSRSFNSDEYQFQTATNSTVLSIATGPTVTPGLTTLSISFTSSNDCTSVVEYGTVSGTYTAATLQTTIASTSHNASLTGLTTGTTYYYRIKLYWDSGNDLVSDPPPYSMATTAEEEPTAAQKARGIWLLGGIPGAVVTVPIAPVDLYDPVTDTWYPAITSIPIPVSFAGYAAYDGKLFIIGGFDIAGAQRNNIQIYDIEADQWTEGAVGLFTSRANIYAAVIFGRIYIQGGTNGNYNGGWIHRNDSWEYNIAGDQMTARVAVPGSERYSFAYENAIYFLGGRTAAATTTNILDAAIYSTNTLTTVAETPLTAALPGRTGIAVAVNRPGSNPASVIMIGGINTFTNTPYCFVNNGATQPTATPVPTVQYLPHPFIPPIAWLTGPSFGGNVAFGSAIVTNATGSPKLYHFGGTASIGAVAAGQNAVYSIPPPVVPNIWSGTWTQMANMPRSRWGHGAVTLNE